ncbi:hypothetical protein VP191E371_P0085 [Vibrio phage 191E37-1]|nr:hypothetical protein VP191E371_P0085 [Vibrio phage 191E37-1]CAH9013242.1 hypothetical protein VP115E341_P0088 [Vibrio phage 115E34-1]CAH9016407.1 hypothetical protein VP511E551_P0090 [Vibrio phage 511E55-1]CAH9016988.1 hypothetical protein VP217E381_P0089 [Vibrio phage 217E38-1]
MFLLCHYNTPLHIIKPDIRSYLAKMTQSVSSVSSRVIANYTEVI